MNDLRNIPIHFTLGVRDLEGLGEELSQSDFLTPYKHDVIASKLEGDLLKNLKLDKEDSAIIYKEEDDLLKATEMEFIKGRCSQFMVGEGVEGNVPVFGDFMIIFVA